MKSRIWHWLSLLLIGSLLLSLTGVFAISHSVAASPLTKSASLPTTGEASQPGPTAVRTVEYNPTPRGETGPGIYLVRLADAPLSSYRGGIPGLAATSPAATDQRGLNLKSPVVAAYTHYLAGKRAEFLKAAHQALGRQLEVAYEYYAANHGLAVTLTPEEALKIAALPGVIFVQRDFERELHTDNGPTWIGAPALWNGSGVPGGVGSMGEGVVVAVIDTGINYSNPSFAAVGPVDGYVHTNPLGSGTFLGGCAPGKSYTTYCNDKLIGVRGYPTVNSGNPVDYDGHGSHTASTAAGNFVTATLAAPTTVLTRSISGVAPHANIIAYAACCTTSALTAAIDDVVLDYAAILAVNPAALMTVNYSIGSDSPADPWSDFDSVGYLNAREAGIFVATSAGNAGPGDETVGSPAGAPWLTSVGATTHDRDFVNELVDMSGGATTPPADMRGAGITAGYGPAPIVYAGDYGYPLCATGPEDAPTNPFPPETFDGEIVVCDRGTYARVDKGLMVLQSGAGGMVLADNGDGIVSDPHYLPAVHISLSDGIALKAWIASGSGHQATISGFYLDVADANADVMAGFSSRGANRALPDIIVPSVSAPGVSILAAYGTNNAILWDAISGTSMASPHVAGAAALMMALHPDWTPAEVQSALMTAAWQDVLKEDGITPADPFAMGSGRVDLTVAAMAGLVLDETIADYWAADPSIGGDPKTLNLASLGNSQCQTACSWERTLRSTLNETITWTVTVDGPVDLGLSVNPVSFTLSTDGQTQVIEVTADVSALPNNAWVFGEVILTPSEPGIPVARLPVAVKPSTGALPDLLQINTRRNAGSQWIRDLTAIGITNFTVQVFGLARADLHDILLEEDPTNEHPLDDLTQVYYADVTVPTGARRLVAEITASAAPDVDLYVLRDTGSDYVGVCASTTSSWSEYCDLTDPVAGDYRVIVQNWEGSANQPDAITLATAVVSGTSAGNMTVAGPSGSVLEGEPFDLQVFWNTPLMVAGDRWYGAFSLGSKPGSPGDIGVVPVNIVRHADDVAKEVTPVGAFLGETLTYTINVRPNVMPDPLTYRITDTIPAGLTYVAGSGLASSGIFSDAAAPMLTWTGTAAELVTVTYQVTVNEPGVGSPLSNVVSHSVDNAGSRLATASAAVYILGDALKDVSATLINPGEQLTYTIVLTAGPTTEMWTLVDPLPAGLRFVSVDGATYNTSTHSIAWRGALGTGQHIPTEGFEHAFPPLGWLLFETGATDDPGWEQSSAANNILPHTGDYAAYHDDTNTDDPADAWMVTPRFAVPTGGALTFWQADYYQDYYNYHSVWVTTGAHPDPAVSTYTEVYSGDIAASWIQTPIDLSAYAGQEVYLAFRYQGDYNDEWYVDDVTFPPVTAESRHLITLTLQAETPGYYTNVAQVESQGRIAEVVAPAVFVYGAVPTWEKDVWINNTAYDWQAGPFTVVDGDTVTVVDRIQVAFNAPISYTLQEDWTPSLALTSSAATFGSVTPGTGALTWNVGGGVAETWYVLTKTFLVNDDHGFTDLITETLVVENGIAPQTRQLMFQIPPRPEIAVAPQHLSSLQGVDVQVTRPLTISNNGNVNLDWSIISGTVPLSCGANWLNVAPVTGTLARDTTRTVDVTFDSTGLAAAIYTANLCVASNDPVAPLITVPVTLTVLTQDTYILDVVIDPPGSGTVDVDPAGPYHANAVVTLTAESNTGWTFERWSGGLGTNAMITVTIEGNTVITATFVELVSGLAINKSVTPAENLKPGDTVTYTLTLINNGEVEATGVMLTDVLPSAVEFGAFVGNAGGAVEADSVIAWSGDLAVGETLTIVFTATVVEETRTIKLTVVTNRVAFTSANAGSGMDEASFTLQPLRAIFLPLVLRNF